MKSVYSFDYVRLVIRSASAELSRDELERLHTIYLKNGGSAKAWRSQYLPENLTSHSGFMVDVWGYDAHIFATKGMLVEDWAYATRADLRVSLLGSGPFEEVAKAIAQQFIYRKGRQTFCWTTSPVRVKKDGRDAGGMGFRAGTYGSRNCLKLYRRGREGWAIEHTFQYDALQHVVAEAATDYISDAALWPFTDHLLIGMRHAACVWAERVLGFTCEGAMLLWPSFKLDEAGTGYERLLQAMTTLDDERYIDLDVWKGGRQKGLSAAALDDEEYEDKTG